MQLAMASDRVVDLDDGFAGLEAGFPNAVATVLLKPVEIAGGDVSGHVFAVEY